MNVPARTSIRLLPVALLAAALVAPGCTSEQTTRPGTIGVEREQTMSPLVSEESLEAGAATAYREILGKAEQQDALNTDEDMVERVRRIASRIIPETATFRDDAPGWDWQVNVIETDELNAWAMPGGKIAFYSGIIDRLELSENEVAAIMGHEIAHALREHSRERASEQAVSSLALNAGLIAGSVLTGIDLGQMSGAAQLAYQVTFGLPNSREQETEADRIGVELAARAGYDPRAAVNVWRKMSAATEGKSGPEFLSTHPSPDSRIADLEQYAAKVMPLYEKAR